MTASSPKSGRARFASTLYQADDPIDAAFARNVAGNNVLHSADEQCRVLVNWCSMVAANIVNTPRMTVGITGGGTFDAWVPVRTFGPFALSVREPGDAYKLRVRCASSVASAGPAARIAVTVGSAETLSDVVYSTGENGVEFVPASGTTPTVLTPTTSNIVTLSRSEIESAYVARPTLDDTSGDPVEVLVPEVVIRLWAKRSTPAIRIHQLHVAEYVG